MICDLNWSTGIKLPSLHTTLHSPIAQFDGFPTYPYIRFCLIFGMRAVPEPMCIGALRLQIYFLCHKFKKQRSNF
jgi:hypothetical protein